jgi:hypothetical protein
MLGSARPRAIRVAGWPRTELPQGKGLDEPVDRWLWRGRSPALGVVWNPVQLVRAGHQIDRNDALTGDSESDDAERAAGGGHDQPGGAVDDRRPGQTREAGAASGDRLGDQSCPDHRWARWLACAADVGPQHHLRIKDGQQRPKVTGPSRSQERVDDAALHGQVGVGAGCLEPDAAAGAAGQLPGGGRAAPQDLGDVLEREREDVVEDERQAFGGVRVSRTTSKASPSVSARATSSAGSSPSSGTTRGSGSQVPRGPRVGSGGPQHVQADPADDGGEPGAQVDHAGGVGSLEP